MMHPLPGGQFLLAIGFMGTGKRFYDWISNFRFTTEEGFHKGFYQLCTYFEQGAESIVFPATAKALGLEKLTLGEVLSEMKSLSSRFRLWMAGHSQGAAVMQVFCHRLMTDWGVLAQNMTAMASLRPLLPRDAWCRTRPPIRSITSSTATTWCPAWRAAAPGAVPGISGR